MRTRSNSHLTWILGACALLLFPARASAREVAEVLDRAREAIGWERVVAHPGYVRVVGAARMLGTDALQTEVFDGRGRWVQSFVGPLPTSSGFDGEIAWSRDWNGTPRVLELGDWTLAQASNALLTGAWVATSAPFDFSAVREEGDELVLVFSHRSSPLEGTVRLDAATHLPRSAAWTDGPEELAWTFDGYRDHGGFRFPDEVAFVQSGQTQALTARKVEFVQEVGSQLFEPRLARPQDTTFTAGISPSLEVKQVRSGHLLVHPTVGGKDLGWFIFDTGAGVNCISSSVTDQLAEGPFGQVVAQGVGGKIESPFWRAEELQLGPVTMKDPIFMELDLSFLTGPFGVEVGGIIGYELIARCVVEFDMATPAIALRDPVGYELPTPGKWEEVLLYGRHPCVRAEFEGHEGIFNIDTGAAGDWVAIHYQAVEDLGLTESRETRAGSAGGVGGRVSMRVGKAESFVLGGREFKAIEAEFATEDRGVFSNDYIWGNIGGQLIGHFVMVLDYSNKRIGFVPRDEP